MIILAGLDGIGDINTSANGFSNACEQADSQASHKGGTKRGIFYLGRTSLLEPSSTRVWVAAPTAIEAI